MNNLSFDIKTTSDFLKKLIEDHKEFCKDRTSSRVALNCAMTAWHLTEWAYSEFNHQLSARFTTLGSYQREIKTTCPSLQIMHDLANGTKHCQLTKHRPIIKETGLRGGAFSSDFSRDFDVSILEIKLNDGVKIYFEDSIEASVNFWKEYLQSAFNIAI